MKRLLVGSVLLMALSLSVGCDDESTPLDVDSISLDQARPPSAPERHTLTLITGDRLEVLKSADGSWKVAIDQAPRSSGPVAFTRFRHPKKGLYVMPVDVKHLIPEVMDAQFFNIEYLIEHKMDDAHQSFVSAIVSTEDSSAHQRATVSTALNYRRLPAAGLSTITVSKNQLRGRANPLWQFTGQRAGLTLSGVKKLRPNRVFKALLAEAVPAVGGDVAQQTHGLYGKGINLAVLDTGVDSAHPDFYFEDGSSKLVVDENLTCFTTDDPFYCEDTPLDLEGHGTHVSSIAVGTGAGSDGLYRGVAPEAWLMNVKVLNSMGFGLETDIIQGIFVAALGTNDVRGDEPEIEADVISMSLGGPVLTDGEDPMIAAVNQVVNDHGVIVVVAAGNDWNAFTVGSPAAAAGALAVGSSTKWAPFVVSDFSSRGPTRGEFALKPDIVAPGEEIIAACSSFSYWLECDPLAPYIAMSGTSMATPVVAGGAALLVEHAAGSGQLLSPQALKDRLLSSSEVLTSLWDPDQPASAYEQGAGLMKLDRALTAELVFSPANLSLGLFTYDVAEWERTAQLTNRSDQTKTVDLAIALTSEYLDYSDAISLTPSQVTLAPGATAELTVRVDLQALPLPKLQQAFDGRITAQVNGQLAAHSILGFTKEGELYPLTIQTIGLDGGPPFWPDVYVYDAEDSAGFFNDPWVTFPDAEGYLRLRVPAGIYNLTLEIYDFADELARHTRVSELELEVANTATSAVLDARLAEPVVFDLAADPLATSTKEFSTTWEYVWPGDGWSISVGSSGFDQLMVYSNKQSTIGTFGVLSQWVRGHEPWWESEVLYNWTDTRGRDEPYLLRVTETDLENAGMADIHYHSERLTEGYIGEWACPTDLTVLPLYCNFVWIWSYLTPLPAVQRQYYNPLVAAHNTLYEPLPWELLLWDNEQTIVDGVLIEGKVWQPGEQQRVHWGQRPMKPAYQHVWQIDNTLGIWGHSVEDPQGHYSLDYVSWPDGLSLAVSVNGAQTALLDDIYYAETPLPTAPALVDLTLKSKSSPSLTDYPVETTTSATFITTGNEVVPVQIPNTRYQVRDLNDFNQVICQGDRTCRLRFSVNFEPINYAIEPVSFFGWILLSTDDGATWFSPDWQYKKGSALTVRSRIRLSEDDPLPVSVKLFAFTSDGVLLSETVKRAFLLKKNQ